MATFGFVKIANKPRREALDCSSYDLVGTEEFHRMSSGAFNSPRRYYTLNQIMGKASSAILEQACLSFPVSSTSRFVMHMANATEM